MTVTQVLAELAPDERGPQGAPLSKEQIEARRWAAVVRVLDATCQKLGVAPSALASAPAEKVMATLREMGKAPDEGELEGLLSRYAGEKASHG